MVLYTVHNIEDNVEAWVMRRIFNFFIIINGAILRVFQSLVVNSQAQGFHSGSNA